MFLRCTQYLSRLSCLHNSCVCSKNIIAVLSSSGRNMLFCWPHRIYVILSKTTLWFSHATDLNELEFDVSTDNDKHYFAEILMGLLLMNSICADLCTSYILKWASISMCVWHCQHTQHQQRSSFSFGLSYSCKSVVVGLWWEPFRAVDCFLIFSSIEWGLVDTSFCYMAVLNQCMLGTLSNPVLVLDFTMEMFLGVEIVSHDGLIWFSNIV